MTTSYPVQALPVNGGVDLGPRLASFYRWLHRWHGETEDLHAATGYYARKQRVSERTIYRWLARLRALGYIVTEQTPGVERRITPVQEPPAKRRAASKPALEGKRVSGVCQGSVSGVSSLIASDAYEASTAPPEAVAALRAEGVPEPVAVRVVQAHGEKAVRNAVSAYRQTKGIRNPVGWLLRAVEGRYQFVPKEVSEGRAEARRLSVVSRPPVPSVNGLQGKAAFDSLRSKLGIRSGKNSSPSPTP
jgi:hypothetical protein